MTRVTSIPGNLPVFPPHEGSCRELPSSRVNNDRTNKVRLALQEAIGRVAARYDQLPSAQAIDVNSSAWRSIDDRLDGALADDDDGPEALRAVAVWEACACALLSSGRADSGAGA